MLTTFNKIKIANIPDNIPIGIEISPNIIPSYNTFFFICFDVAPTLASIPYCLNLSVIEILKLFLITNIAVTTIIEIIIDDST